MGEKEKPSNTVATKTGDAFKTKQFSLEEIAEYQRLAVTESKGQGSQRKGNRKEFRKS